MSLTREQVEVWRLHILTNWKLPDAREQLNALCDLALQALDRPWIADLRAKVEALPTYDIASFATTKWNTAALSRELVLKLIDDASPPSQQGEKG